VAKSTACPCGSGHRYGDCCGRYHLALAVPDSVEALMRSRYTAYTLNLIRYLQATWHPSTLPSDLTSPTALRWLALEVVASEEAGDEGWVTFNALFKLKGERGKMSERSYFLRVDGRWLYHSRCD
jgi:SEC-C motif domain protein